MRVYRCENENGEGPWQAAVSFTELLGPGQWQRWTSHANRLPTLDEEVPSFHYIGNDYSAGVMTEDLFNEWFGPFECELSDYGFTMHVYEVPESYVVKGLKQCVFDKSKAIEVAR